MTKMSNLSTRVIVALFAIPFIIILSIVGKVPFLIFVFFIGVVSFFEFSNILKRRRFFPNQLIGGLSVLAIILNSYIEFLEFEFLFLILVALLLMIELFRNKDSAIANIGASLIGIFYIGLFSSSIVKIREFYSETLFNYDQGGYLIISILAAIWICDSAAYFIGSAFGKHKIFPRISPNKSWEGSLAGFVFSILTMIVAKFILLDLLTLGNAIVIGIIIGLFGQMGDFVESMIKRDANVKDSSSLIPGHGGIFDRFDSLIFSAPLIYIYLYYFAQI
ncbi:MAG: phosphatidate cytidylyltransferase [Melioribacter sp.]|uniref:phosphatidate cytidylyltransferase n=1 Tax=Rosettibacter primus TaxID=3111523 RepID=UPI00247ED722|nr:phosphatidate cytidylyltransferase [Melioribacter sp.]